MSTPFVFSFSGLFLLQLKLAGEIEILELGLEEHCILSKLSHFLI